MGLTFQSFSQIALPHYQSALDRLDVEVSDHIRNHQKRVAQKPLPVRTVLQDFWDDVRLDHEDVKQAILWQNNELLFAAKGVYPFEELLKDVVADAADTDFDLRTGLALAICMERGFRSLPAQNVSDSKLIDAMIEILSSQQIEDPNRAPEIVSLMAAGWLPQDPALKSLAEDGLLAWEQSGADSFVRRGSVGISSTIYVQIIRLVSPLLERLAPDFLIQHSYELAVKAKDISAGFVANVCDCWMTVRGAQNQGRSLLKCLTHHRIQTYEFTAQPKKTLWRHLQYAIQNSNSPGSHGAGCMSGMLREWLRTRGIDVKDVLRCHCPECRQPDWLYHRSCSKCGRQMEIISPKRIVIYVLGDRFREVKYYQCQTCARFNVDLAELDLPNCDHCPPPKTRSAYLIEDHNPYEQLFTDTDYLNGFSEDTDSFF